MAVIYVVSPQPKKALCRLQKRDFENTYICKEMFSHFNLIGATNSNTTEAIKDILTVSDKIVVVGNISEADELNFADEINMEVEYL